MSTNVKKENIKIVSIDVSIPCKPTDKTLRDSLLEKKQTENKLHNLYKLKEFTAIEKTDEPIDVTFEISRNKGIERLNTCEELEIFVRHSTLKPMSFKTNSRFPIPTPAVRNMWKQIVEDVDSFIENNMGIFISCTSYNLFKKNGKEFVTIKDASVMNGGHTLSAILEAIKEDIINFENDGEVRLFIRKYDDDVESKKKSTTSVGLNTCEKQNSTGFAELSSLHTDLKSALGDYASYIEFKPNTFEKDKDTMSFDAIEMICEATIMTPLKRDKNGMPIGKYKFSAGGTKTAPYTRYIEQKEKDETPECEKVFPIMREIFSLTDHIMCTFGKYVSKKKYGSNLEIKEGHSLSPISHQDIGYKFSRLLLYPILSALSEDICYNEKTGEISLYIPLNDLYDMVAEGLWSKLNDFAKNTKDFGKYTFCNSRSATSLWNDLHSYVRLVVEKSKECKNV